MKEYFYKFLKIREVFFGNEYVDVVVLFCNFGVIYSVLDDLEIVENFF